MATLHDQFTITLLPNRVSIYTLESTKTSAFQLIKTLFSGGTYFISLTISECEISIITDAPMDDWLMKDPSKFRIFEFHEGASGIDHCGIVQTLSKLFSSNGVEILYVNTFNKNFIVVKEDNIEICKKLIGL